MNDDLNRERHVTTPTQSARSTGATRAMRWALTIAAVAVLGLLVARIDRAAPEKETPIGVETIRGTELLAVTPAGATDQLREFTWQSPLDADRYRVIVRRGTTVIWRQETPQLRLAPPPTGTIERDVQYEWQVEALDRDGNVRTTSSPQSFVVY